VDLAEQFTKTIKTVSGYGQGFRGEYKTGIYDWLGIDNGVFFEVMGNTPIGQPITRMAYGIRQLDSLHVTRTGDPLFPIIYEDLELGGINKYHWSRVIMLSQMPSARKDMFKVGRSNVGRSVRIGEILNSQIIYKLEQMGSRPTNEIIYVKGGEAADIIQSMMLSDEIMDSMGLTRFRKAITMGLPVNGDLGRIRMNDFANFDEEMGTLMAMYALAYIWAIDIRDIWPMQGSQQGNEVSHMAARGRLPAEFTEDFAEQFTLKLCPDPIEAVYDYQDDDQDRDRALARDIRSRFRERNANSGIIDREAEQRMMVNDGDLTREEFIRMQLRIGKLEDGTPIATLFYSQDELTQQLLALPGISNPLLFSKNDERIVLSKIEENKTLCYQLLAQGGRKNTSKANQALAALEWLETQYKRPIDLEVTMAGLNGPQEEEE
jgi:hypothetical protein